MKKLPPKMRPLWLVLLSFHPGGPTLPSGLWRGSLRSEGPRSQPRKVVGLCGIESLSDFPQLSPGSFLHTLEGPSFRASQRIYAHRVLAHVLAFSVSIARLITGSEPITVPLRADFSPESPDLDLHVGPDFQGLR